MTGGAYGEGGGQPPDKNIKTTDPNTLEINLSNTASSEIGDQTQDKILSNRLNNINFNNRYREDSKGPFSIFVEHKYLNFGKLHPLRISEKLYNLGGDEICISYLEIVGRNRVQVFCKSAFAANTLVVNPVFDQNNLIAYVPSYLTEKKGLIRGVDTSFSEEELLNIIESNINIKSVKRRYKNVLDKEGKTIKVPRQQVVITFDKLELPQYIYIYKLRHDVEVWYSPVSQCFDCLNYGHTSNQCKGKKRCKICSEFLPEGKNKCDSCSVFCMHCKTDSHSTTNKTCPMFLIQKRTKEAMANLNVSFKEAEKIIDRPSYSSLVSKNKFAPLMLSQTEFPSLPVENILESSHLPNQTNTQRSQKKLTQPSTSFSQSSKKRKVVDRSPNFEPIRREFDWSYTGSTITQGHDFLNENSIKEFKARIRDNLKQKITHSIKPLVRPNLVNVFENINIGDIIESTVGEILKQWDQQNKG